MEIKALKSWNKEYQFILDKINIYAEMPDDAHVQKKKFTLLTELLLMLCTSRNVKDNFKNLTSLILLLLNIYKKNYPIDIYSKDTKELQLTTKHRIIKHILSQELKNGMFIP
ncbi:MAG: hypothetical protein ACXABG_00035 [Promethearchaeota archaeon]